jgi:hypothetical protein
MSTEPEGPMPAFHCVGHEPEVLAVEAYNRWHDGAGSALPPAKPEVVPRVLAVREGFVAGFLAGWRANRGGGGGSGPEVRRLLREIERLRAELHGAEEARRHFEQKYHYQQQRIGSAIGAVEHGLSELHNAARD